VNESRPPNTILLVDDEETFRQRLERAFARRGFTVFGAGNYDEAMQLVRAHRPARAVIDLKMTGRSGLEVLTDALAIAPELQALVLTGFGSIATATEAIRRGAVNYIPKPADVDDILRAFDKTTPSSATDQDADFAPPTLARAEWEHIQRVLADCDGNISAAAERLGLHRRTLQRKLYKYPPNK